MVVIGSVFGVVGLAVGFVASSVVNFALFSAAGAGAGVVAGSAAEVERCRRLKYRLASSHAVQ